jgi:hypothetical protein
MGVTERRQCALLDGDLRVDCRRERDDGGDRRTDRERPQWALGEEEE